jgi:amidase
MTLFKKFLQLSAITILIGTLLCCGKYFVKPAQDSVPAHFKSATELTSAIRSGDITSLDLLNLYLNRIQRYNNEINAVVALDIAAARERAAEADKALARGEIWGPLHGLPVGIQIIGARFEDRTTIDFARGLSETIGGFAAPPGYED